jgi:hypothetical protein
MLGRESIGPEFNVDNTGLGMEDFQMDIDREDLLPVELIREKSAASSELSSSLNLLASPGRAPPHRKWARKPMPILNAQ